jgi:hypothetical protein
MLVSTQRFHRLKQDERTLSDYLQELKNIADRLPGMDEGDIKLQFFEGANTRIIQNWLRAGYDAEMSPLDDLLISGQRFECAILREREFRADNKNNTTITHLVIIVEIDDGGSEMMNKLRDKLSVQKTSIDRVSTHPRAITPAIGHQTTTTLNVTELTRLELLIVKIVCHLSVRPVHIRVRDDLHRIPLVKGPPYRIDPLRVLPGLETPINTE